MRLPLPSIWAQKRKPFRPTDAQVSYYYNLLNHQLFGDQLTRPSISLNPMRLAWGLCTGEKHVLPSGSRCTIKLMDKWYSAQWFINILAHEMVHQYQWDILGPQRKAHGKNAIMSHGPSFFYWCASFKHHGLNLRACYRVKPWFRYQNFNKC
jgi:hypothetical protein